MKNGSRWITLTLIFLSVLAATASITINHMSASAEGAPSLFPADQYDDPYYNQPGFYVGTGFSANSLVTLTWTNLSGKPTAGTTQTDTQGTFHFTIKHMPSIPHKTLATLSAIDSHGIHATTQIRETPFISSRQVSGSIGTTIDITGGGFASIEKVELSFNQTQTTPIARITTSADGTFHATFKIPTTAQPGSFSETIEAKGTSGAVALAGFTVI